MHKDVVLSLRIKCLSAVLSCDTVYYDVQSVIQNSQRKKP